MSIPAVLECVDGVTNNSQILLCRRTEGRRRGRFQDQRRGAWETLLGARRGEDAGPVVADIRHGRGV